MTPTAMAKKTLKLMVSIDARLTRLESLHGVGTGASAPQEPEGPAEDTAPPETDGGKGPKRPKGR